MTQKSSPLKEFKQACSDSSDFSAAFIIVGMDIPKS